MNQYVFGQTCFLPFTVIFLAWSSWFALPMALAQDLNTVKVFILAGQSNMEGKADNALLEFQASDDATRERFAHLRKDDQWIVRDDVFIKFLDRSGKLTIGYGSPGKTGVELEFGTLLGDHFESPVLLIKTAWGGHSLYKQFRSPSSGLPTDEALSREWEEAKNRVTQNNERHGRQDPLPTLESIKEAYGNSYRQMLNDVEATRKDYQQRFPELDGKVFEISGFVWFQGFNDMFGDGVPQQYRQNLVNLIRDIRRDLNSPNLPIVIGALGQNGSQPARDAMLIIQQAQLAMNDVAEFQGNVKAIRTDELVDKAAEELFPDWEQQVEAWKKVGSDRPYHYLGSAIWFNRIGNAMGRAMLELLELQSPN